jgi:hypothetical protein
MRQQLVYQLVWSLEERLSPSFFLAAKALALGLHFKAIRPAIRSLMVGDVGMTRVDTTIQDSRRTYGELVPMHF